MKTRFFLCMRPTVIETNDKSSYTTVSGKTSGRRNRGPRQSKRVAPEKFSGQLPIKLNDDISDGSLKAPKIISGHLKSFSDEESVILNKLSMISNDEVNPGRKSNSGTCIMVSSLIFTMFFGKLVGIVGTLILVCSLYPHRKNGGGEVRISENMVVNMPEKLGSPEEYKKRVIMAGLLERKCHYR